MANEDLTPEQHFQIGLERGNQVRCAIAFINLLGNQVINGIIEGHGHTFPTPLFRRAIDLCEEDFRQMHIDDPDVPVGLKEATEKARQFTLKRDNHA